LVATVGLVVVGLAAAVASSFGLYGLGASTGWPGPLAVTLPVVVDALAATSTAVWLSASAPTPARRYARVLALAGITASVVGNAVWHVLSARAAGLYGALVVIVGAVPALALAGVAHLAALLAAGRDEAPPAPPVAPPVVESAHGPAQPAAQASAQGSGERRAPMARQAAQRPARDTGRRPAGRPALRAVVSAEQAEQRMAAYWLAETAAGRQPTGGQLARVGGVSSATGRRRAAYWRVTPPSAHAAGEFLAGPPAGEDVSAAVAGA
jgi:hypothetical protein